jgi:hypothetical protein
MENKSSKMMPPALTHKQHKRAKRSSTPGKDKGENCHATGLDKAMAKYPKSYKTYPQEYRAFLEKKSSYWKQ